LLKPRPNCLNLRPNTGSNVHFWFRDTLQLFARFTLLVEFGKPLLPFLQSHTASIQNPLPISTQARADAVLATSTGIGPIGVAM
jgi:hypothetical protein